MKLPASGWTRLGAVIASGIAVCGVPPVLAQDARAAIGGPVKIASVRDGDALRITVDSDGKYTAEQRAAVLEGARMMQREVRRACGRQCKPGKMPAPVLNAKGELHIELTVTGLAGEASKEDVVNLVMGKPLAARKPVAVPKPAASAAIEPAAPASSTGSE